MGTIEEFKKICSIVYNTPYYASNASVGIKHGCILPNGDKLLFHFGGNTEIIMVTLFVYEGDVQVSNKWFMKRDDENLVPIFHELYDYFLKKEYKPYKDIEAMREIKSEEKYNEILNFYKAD